MSSATATKKPPVPGTATARRQSTNPASTTPTPNRSPSRISTQNGTATGTAAAPSINRTRSVRTGAPVSARAAARKSTMTNDADHEAKAEMQVKMEELQEQLRQAEENSAAVEKQAAVLQVKLDEALKEQGILEENMHEHIERINDLENDKKQSDKARRDMEQIYESERAAFTKEREENQSNQEEAQSAIQRLKETLAQRDMRAHLDDGSKPNISRNSSFRNSMSSSPNPDAGQFAPPSMQRSDSSSRNSSRLVMQKDKVIEGLRLELAESQIRLVEVENMGGGRRQKMENEMYEVKVQNARLMEENESFQLLLSEKTLNGDFSNSEFLRPSSNAGSRPSSRHHAVGNSLADELEGEEDGDVSEEVRKLHGEVAAAKDQNKALTLYINNIISRLLQHDQFEQILDKTPDLMSGPPVAGSRFQPTPNTEKELPPPPPAEKDEQPTGLLQRARSVMGGKKPRPQSQIITSDQAPKATENPDTAPRVPLTERRSASGHRRANSEWAAASVVNSMYRGPSPGNMTPGSPGLGSPTQRPVSYFSAAPLGARMPSGPRQASGNSVPTIAEVTASTPASEVPTGASSAGPTSAPNLNRLSTPSDPSDPQDEAAAAEPSNPASPPRSVTSSNDRESRAGGPSGSGAIMMGSKMRPLRLVQGAEDESAKNSKANRGSWFGWMNNKGAGPAAPHSPRYTQDHYAIIGDISACYFLEKLAPELRNKIYEYVLDFDDVPLHHAKQLRPFVKKITGVDGELPFAFEDQVTRDPALAWLEGDSSPPLDDFPVNTSILSTNKVTYTEAVKVFYDLNVISVDIELFKLTSVISPIGSDLSLAKRLLVKFNGSHDAAERVSRGFNSIDLDGFLPRAQIMFPKVKHIQVHTDRTAQPSRSFFDIGQDCLESPAVEEVRFGKVGGFVATTYLGLELAIDFKKLVDLWKRFAAMSAKDRHFLKSQSAYSLESRVVETQQVLSMVKGWLNDPSAIQEGTEFMQSLSVDFQEQTPDAFATYSTEDNVLWTWLAGGYPRYDRVRFLR